MSQRQDQTAHKFMDGLKRFGSWLWKFQPGQTIGLGALTHIPDLNSDHRGAIYIDEGSVGIADEIIWIRKNAADQYEFTTLSSDLGIIDLISDLDSLYVAIGAFNARGDLLVGGANDLYNTIPVGDDGQFLVADSGEVSGVAWSDTLESATNNRLLHLRYTASNGNAPRLDFEKSRSGGAVSALDELALLVFYGHDGTDFRAAAQLQVMVNPTPGASDMPGMYVFSTSPDGTITPTEKVRIGANSVAINIQKGDYDTSIAGDTDDNVLYVDASADAVGIGTNAPVGSKLDVNDDSIRIRTAKTPASAGAAGTQGEIAWDATHIYVCVATNSWVRATLAAW